MFVQFENFLGGLLSSMGVAESYNFAIILLISTVIVAVICFLADYIAKKIMLTLLMQFAKKSKTVLDDILVEKRFFHRLAQLAPALVVYLLAPVILHRFPTTIYWVQIAVKSFMIFVGMRVVDSFLNSMHAMYHLLPDSKHKPIKGYVQVVKILINAIGILLILGVVFDKSLVYFFSGLGALAAVLMLVFKDSILGLVAGIQLSSNDMLKPGDWITFTKYGADGKVIEISLQTVKVQNFDKTIVTIPTYSLIAESFQNWRGMEESTGRRFKRIVTVDPRYVKHFSPDLLKPGNTTSLKKFLDAVQSKKQDGAKEDLLPATNLGLFRQYIVFLLHNSTRVNNEMPHLVKLGNLTEHGLQVEIVCFTHEKGAEQHEQFQSELVEHLLAVSGSFELEIYVKPSGNDVKSKG